jgi:cyclophilin family peptidyl-prolyl cis-trans isomerase
MAMSAVNQMSSRGSIVSVGLILGLAVGSCVPVVDDGVVGPGPVSDLRVQAVASAAEVFEGSTATLSATAMNGAPPYTFRWDQNAGPAVLTLTDFQSDTLTPPPLTRPGRYNFRVVATDSEGATAVDFVAVESIAAFLAEVPRLIVVDEPASLTAEITEGVEDFELLWMVTQGTASIENATSPAARLTASTGETLDVSLTITLNASSASASSRTETFEIVAVTDLMPRVVVETNFGDFTMQFEGELAPLHTANFLAYVDDGFFDGLLFHRNACTPVAGGGVDDCEPFVIQGGGFRRDAEGEFEEVAATRDPVPSEADNGLTNGTLYSVSMALLGGDPDSGDTQYFINLADNSFLDGQSFTVFANVVAGTDVIDAIAASERLPNPLLGNEVSLPAEDVIMVHIVRAEP